jgi:hypothetical protein
MAAESRQQQKLVLQSCAWSNGSFFLLVVGGGRHAQKFVVVRQPQKIAPRQRQQQMIIPRIFCVVFDGKNVFICLILYLYL